MNNATCFRIAWLLPSIWFYWQPVLSRLAKQFPQTKLFTTRWTGFAKGYEGAFAVQEVGQKKFIPIIPSATGYSRGITYLSPGIINSLLQFKPHVIFSNSFGIWTVLALLFKPVGRWSVVIAYEGSSPNVDYRNSPIRLKFRQLMVRVADAFITNSLAGKTYLVDILKAPEDQVFTRPYEVPVAEVFDDAALAPELETLDLQKPVFLYVGKIVPRKGLNLLLEACATLKQQGFEQFTLLCVGSGEQRQELETFCQQQQLQDCVKWVGRVEYHRLSSYFRAADAFVFPTLEDTWGMVVLEAMLFGKPILCSKWAGAADLVSHGINGYVFDPREPAEIATAMRQFFENPNLAVEMGQKSREVIAEYTPEAAAELLAAIATTVINKGTHQETP